MKDSLPLGPTPSEEPCAQVGEPHYRQRALKECVRFLQLLRQTFGPEPEGAWLSIKWFAHDFGEYAEVVCSYNTDIQASVDYAFRCEAATPATGRKKRRSYDRAAPMVPRCPW